MHQVEPRIDQRAIEIKDHQLDRLRIESAKGLNHAPPRINDVASEVSVTSNQYLRCRRRLRDEVLLTLIYSSGKIEICKLLLIPKTANGSPSMPICFRR